MQIITITYKNTKIECLVDDDDYMRFGNQNWVWRSGYPSRNRKKSDPPGPHWIHLYHEILKAAGHVIGPGMVVDHIDRNPMNNQKANLRIVTKSINGKNVSDEEKKRRSNIALENVKINATKPRTQKQIETVRNNANLMNSSGSNVHFGEDNYLSKKVKNLETGEIYSCVREAAEKCGYVYSTLRSRLNGSLKNNTKLIKIKD